MVSRYYRDSKLRDDRLEEVADEEAPVAEADVEHV
jgi:hypothetical protein